MGFTLQCFVASRSRVVSVNTANVFTGEFEAKGWDLFSCNSVGGGQGLLPEKLITHSFEFTGKNSRLSQREHSFWQLYVLMLYSVTCVYTLYTPERHGRLTSAGQDTAELRSRQQEKGKSESC